MTNPNVKLGQMYCNTHDEPLDTFVASCVRLYKLKHDCPPPSIQLSAADKNGIEEYEGIRIVYDHETPPNHAFLEVAL